MLRWALAATLAFLIGTGPVAAEPFELDLGPLGASCVAYSSDGQSLAVATFSELLVIDATTGRKRVASPQADTVWALAFAPEASRLACAVQSPAGKPLKIYDSATLRLVAEMDLENSAATAVAYSPDGRWIAIGCEDRVLLIDAQTLAVVATLRGHAGTIGSVAFSSDGARLTSGCWGSRLIVWDVPERKQVLSAELLADRIMAVAFSPQAVKQNTNHPSATLWVRPLDRRRP
jgi:WD40 repeat protein